MCGRRPKKEEEADERTDRETLQLGKDVSGGVPQSGDVDDDEEEDEEEEEEQEEQRDPPKLGRGVSALGLFAV